jgi:phosphate-selective porin OprO and OprP
MRRIMWALIAAGLAMPVRGQSPDPTVKSSPSPGSKPEVATDKTEGKDTLQFNLADGLRFKSGDGNLEGHVGGYVFADYRSIFERPQFDGANPRTLSDSFFIRLARLEMDGVIYKDYDYRVLADLPTSTTTSTITGALLDGYFGWRKYPELSFRIGQFKVPFSQEFTAPIKFTDLAEFSMLYRLILNRDIGAMLYGDLAGRIVQYEVGVFNGTGRGIYDNNDNKYLASRLRFNPFLTADLPLLKGLRLGVAGSWGHTESAANGAATADPLDFSTTELAVVFLNATAGSLDGPRTRTGVELSWLYSPVSIRAEWMRRRDQADVGATRAYVGEDAWYVSGSWLLTGEEKKLEDRIIPAHPLDPDAGGWGAVELAARVSALDIDNEIFTSGIAPAAGNANKALAVSVGPNWWLTRNIRISPNFIYEKYNDKVDFGSGVQRNNMKGVLVRTQIDF